MLPIINGEKTEREKPLAFGYKRLYKNTEMYALIDGEHKLVIPEMGHESFLFNLEVDSVEQNDLSEKKPVLLDQMLHELNATIESWQNSDDGKDYIW